MAENAQTIIDWQNNWDEALLAPLLNRLSAWRDGPRVLAIDGRCGAGKTTLAASLSRIIGADIVHMDDFFLPPELRTEARLSKPGGNVHYERVLAEVAAHLNNPTLQYGVFDCSSMRVTHRKTVRTAPFLIVEGSYSLHPTLAPHWQISVFLTADQETQRKRILLRNGEDGLSMFLQRWIPMEERYFQSFDIASHADFILR